MPEQGNSPFHADITPKLPLCVHVVVDESIFVERKRENFRWNNLILHYHSLQSSGVVVAKPSQQQCSLAHHNSFPFSTHKYFILYSIILYISHRWRTLVGFFFLLVWTPLISLSQWNCGKKFINKTKPTEATKKNRNSWLWKFLVPCEGDGFIWLYEVRSTRLLLLVE